MTNDTSITHTSTAVDRVDRVDRVDPVDPVDPGQRRRADAIASLVGAIAHDGPAGRRAAIGQLVALGYTRDEISELERTAASWLQTVAS